MVLESNQVKSTIFTLNLYNANLRKQISKKGTRLIYLLLLSLSFALLFQGGPVITTPLSRLVHLTKITWIISIPYFLTQYISSYNLLTDEIILDPIYLIGNRKLSNKRIIFTVLTLGRNPETLLDTVSSNNYWIQYVKERYELDFDSETWVITEEDSLREQKENLVLLRNLGAKIVVVPKDYQTPNGTQFKARALQYGSNIRTDLDLTSDNTWVYHQDEETMIGEDTVIGILDFILNAGNKVMGSGILLYPQNWKQNYLSIQETTRSGNDIGLLGQIRQFGYSVFGYHGSHFIVRADVEKKIGWDFGQSHSEDLTFSIKVNSSYPNRMMPLKGFAYEKPPFNFSDQQKQRKRWIRGAIEVLYRDDVDIFSKIMIFYGLISWLSAFPSILSAILNIYLRTGGIIRYGGVMAGFIWFIIYHSYKSGAELHCQYVESYESLGILQFIQLVPQFIAAILSDAVGPWNALLFPRKSYDNIQKDVL
jgi:hypothetical protein